MTDTTLSTSLRFASKPLWGIVAAAVLLVAAMVFDTTVVQIGSDRDVQVQRFSPDVYGARQFPVIRQSVAARAVDAVALSQAIAADRKLAGEQYGVATSIGPILPVKFTGVVGERKANTHVVAIDGLTEGLTVRVQTGPALNGTDLRDATGQIEFGQFKNQIEYQDAGSAINNEVKKVVLADIDLAELSGKTVVVTGVFKLVNPKNWLVTPVRFDVQ